MLHINSSANYLDNLAKFIKQTFDAHTVAVFQSIEIEEHHQVKEIIEVAGYSSERNIDLNYKTISGHGIVGQIVANQQDLVVQNFLNNSRTLGFYKSHIEIKSIVAIPVLINGRSGAIFCDSLAPNFFNNHHIENLKTAHALISERKNVNTLTAHAGKKTNFEKFYTIGTKLINKLGVRSVEILRVNLSNFSEIEKEIGLIKTINLFEKMNRLIGQALPSHFPMICTPQGESIIMIDNMMSSFFINKIRLIAAQVGPEDINLDYHFEKFQITSYKNHKIEDIFESLVLKEESSKKKSGLRKLLVGS